MVGGFKSAKGESTSAGGFGPGGPNPRGSKSAVTPHRTKVSERYVSFCNQKEGIEFFFLVSVPKKLRFFSFAVHFGLRIIRGLAFGFRFLSKIQTGFRNFFRFIFDLSGN